MLKSLDLNSIYNITSYKNINDIYLFSNYTYLKGAIKVPSLGGLEQTQLVVGSKQQMSAALDYAAVEPLWDEVLIHLQQNKLKLLEFH